MKKYSNKQAFKEVLCELPMNITRTIILSILWVDKKVWKGVFNLETPLYKLWWANKVKRTQKKLDILKYERKLQTI